jgi:hypothetical protein
MKYSKLMMFTAKFPRMPAVWNMVQPEIDFYKILIIGEGLQACTSVKLKTLNKERKSQLLYRHWFFSLWVWEFLDNCFCFAKYYANYPHHQNHYRWQLQHELTYQHNVSLSLYWPLWKRTWL